MTFTEMLRQYLRDVAPGGALSTELTKQGLFDTAAVVTAPVPVVGDVAGLFSDIYRFKTQPEERTPANFALSALGVLPFVPAMSVVRTATKEIDTPALNIFKTKDGRQFTISREDGAFVAKDLKGNMIGSIDDFTGLRFSKDNPPFVMGSHVEDAWRGQGVGHQLYEAAKKSTGGVPLVPSDNLTDDAFNYWKRSQPELLKETINQRAQESVNRLLAEGRTRSEMLQYIKESGASTGLYPKALDDAFLKVVKSLPVEKTNKSKKQVEEFVNPFSSSIK